MLKKMESMNLKQKLNYGYGVVIALMIVSALFSMLGLWILFGYFNSYVNGPQKADTAVKLCRIEVNIAARNIREMAINDDVSTYSAYKETVVEKLNDVGSQLKILKGTEMVDDELYQRYETALSDWGEMGYEIMSDIEAGNKEEANRKILEECAPALQQVVDIANEIDAITDAEREDAISSSVNSAIGASVLMIVFVVLAATISRRIGRRIVNSIVTPLREIENVANGLADGNLHTSLKYHSQDEMGALAHNLRKSVNILSSYVDDIGRAMNEFSQGNFDVKPHVEWKGDFIGIKDSIIGFEKSISETISGIQQVADQVKNGSEQVASSSNELAEGAAEQASVTEELTATLTNVSEQVAKNAQHAKNISKNVDDAGKEILNSNKKMQEMVASMKEISNASEQISKIIATINDIASQTNLLALNASIEAARAGEAGKGFAVVADQVSVLAAQSAEAAKESTALIEASVRAVEKGMVVADETAGRLESIVVSSQAITEDVNQVAMVLEEQTEAISQISDGVEQINDVVQTNSATSQECAAASQEMSGQAVNLEGLIDRFQITDF